MPIQHLDRRQQPANPLKAMEQAIVQTDWSIMEITRHTFISGNGKWVNESHGYRLHIPKTLPGLRRLWVGYLKHTEVPPGFYSGLIPGSPEVMMKALKSGYRESPFSGLHFLKHIVPLAELREMERKFGIDEITSQLKEILVKVYPFNLK